MQAEIPIANDFAGLSAAALEMLEEQKDAPLRARMETMARIAQNAEALRASLAAKRKFADGYYLRLRYLLELEAMLGICGHSRLAIDLAEARGIMAIERARTRFRADHPPCRGCGKLLDSPEETKCLECWAREKQ